MDRLYFGGHDECVSTQKLARVLLTLIELMVQQISLRNGANQSSLKCTSYGLCKRELTLKRNKFSSHRSFITRPILKHDQLIFMLAELQKSLLHLGQQLLFHWECDLFQSGNWDLEALDRSSQGILAVLLSLKKYPIIRYQYSSEMARRLAETIRVSMTAAIDKVRKDSSSYEYMICNII